MRKLLRYFSLAFVCLFGFVLFGACNKGGEKATLNEWSVPVYNNVTVGSSVFLQTVRATDSKGNSYVAEAQIVGPNGVITPAADNTFKADAEGTYTIVYTIAFNGDELEKVATFTATASGNPDNPDNPDTPDNPDDPDGPDNPSQPDAVLGALKVIEGSEQFFSVSGNTVTVLQTIDADSWKTIGWTLSGWTMENGASISIKITNNTTGTISLKYKAVTDGGEQYGYPDLSIAPGESDTYSKPTGTDNDPEPASVSSIELAIGATAAGGTFTVEAQLIGSGTTPGGDVGTTQLGPMTVTAGAEDYFSVSGNTVTIKQAARESDYKSLSFTVANWDKANAASVAYTVKNNTSGQVTIKYKVTTDTGVGWGYPDTVTAAGETKTYTGATVTNDQGGASEVTLIELFIITDATGTIEINLSLF